MRVPRILLAALALLPCLPASALDAPTKVVDYDIRVRFNPEIRAFEGRELLRWRNPSAERVAELRFHLYWNAFRNERSTFLRELGAGRFRKTVDAERFGSIRVTAMTWEGRDLLAASFFDAPDDGNADDRTVLVVPLPRAVEAGETIALDIAWKGVAPRLIARAGQVRDFVLAGQWFPKIGVLEPAGRRGRTTSGWNCHQYHADSEFYADWGDYRVAITLPERFVVAAAGLPAGETRAGGLKTVTFEQRSIHDFAWSADPRFVVRDDVFDPATDLPPAEVERAAKLLSRTPAELLRGFHKVQLRFCMQPDHVAQWTRYRDAQKWTLAWLGLYAFPYPYERVTVIDTPEDGVDASGMEYQTFYTAGTWRWLGRWPLDKLLLPENVVIHEFAHGYFYGLLASNEFEEAWLDEGFATFLETEAMDRRYGFYLGLPLGVRVAASDQEWLFGTRASYDPIILPAWRYASNGSYGANSYFRPALALEQIRALLGDAAFWRAFRAYAERWRFDHPGSEDFFATVRAAARGTPAQGALEELIAKVFHGTGAIDVRVLSASCRKLEAEGGDAPKVAPGKGKGGAAPPPKERFLARALVARDGEVALPVDVRLTYADGTSEVTRWDGRDRWLRIERTVGSKLVRVEVDPERRLLLDSNPWNNVWAAPDAPGASAARKVRTYAIAGLESALAVACGVL